MSKPVGRADEGGEEEGGGVGSAGGKVGEEKGEVGGEDAWGCVV